MTIIWALVAYIIHFVISNKVVHQIISHSRVTWFIFTPKIIIIIIKLIYYSTYENVIQQKLKLLGAEFIRFVNIIAWNV